MNNQVKAGIVITAIILLAFVLIYAHRSARSPVPTTRPGIKKSSVDMRKDMPQHPGISAVKGRKHVPSPKESKHRTVSGHVHRKISALINDLADPELSKVERNRIEHMLGSNQDKRIAKEIGMMLEDGLLDLSEQSRTGMARLMSAVRIAGLRSDTKSVEGIINICTHPEADGEVEGAEACLAASDAFRTSPPTENPVARAILEVVLAPILKQMRKCGWQDMRPSGIWEQKMQGDSFERSFPLARAGFSSRRLFFLLELLEIRKVRDNSCPI